MTKSALVLGFVAVLSVPRAARADLITGVLNTGGAANLTSDGITFLDNEFFINSPAAAQQGGFTALEGTTGGIDNITNPPDATGVLAVPVPDFITFAAAPNITITLTDVLPGIDGAAGCTDTPPAAGQVCTPDLPVQSPLNLQNTSSTSSTASFAILGFEVDSITGDTIPITGEFTLPFTGQNFQELLATTVGDDGTVTTSFSAQFATIGPVTGTVPEPAEVPYLLVGLAAVIFVARRKSATAA
jgi:hypothetical protein